MTVTSSTDEKFKAFGELLRELGAKSAYIGVLASGKANEAHESSGDEPLTVLQVATWNEFGTGEIPERSFLRDTLSIKKAEVEAFAAKQIHLALTGKIAPDWAHDRIGQEVQGMCQKRIADGIAPANAQSTIDKKGSDKPLVGRTGVLRASITYEVR